MPLPEAAGAAPAAAWVERAAPSRAIRWAAGEPRIAAAVQNGPAPLRLLTHVQYDNTVEDLLGNTSRPSQRFPAENEVLGYRNNVAANQVNPRLVESFQSAAEALSVEAVTNRLEAIAPCASGAEPAECGRSFIREFR